MKIARAYGQPKSESVNSVTESDIIRVANKYFRDDNYVLSAVKK